MDATNNDHLNVSHLENVLSIQNNILLYIKTKKYFLGSTGIKSTCSSSQICTSKYE